MKKKIISLIGLLILIPLILQTVSAADSLKVISNGTEKIYDLQTIDSLTFQEINGPPTATLSVTPGNILNESNVGPGTFQITATFSEEMSDDPNPGLKFISSVALEGSGKTFTRKSEGWADDHMSYTWVYDVNDYNVNWADFSLIVSGAKDLVGYVMVNDTLSGLAVDTKKPRIIAAVPSVYLINDKAISETSEFHIDVTYDEDMDKESMPFAEMPQSLLTGTTQTLEYQPSSSDWSSFNKFQFVYQMIDNNYMLMNSSVRFRSAKDKAGNTQEIDSVSMKDTLSVDTQNPTCTIEADFTNIDLGKVSKVITFTLTYDKEMDADFKPNLTWESSVMQRVNQLLQFQNGNWVQEPIIKKYVMTYVIQNGDENITDIDVIADGAKDIHGNAQVKAVRKDYINILMAITELLNDGFEAYPIAQIGDPWDVRQVGTGSENQKYIDAPTATGDRAAEMQGNSSSSLTAEIARALGESPDIVYAEFKVMTTNDADSLAVSFSNPADGQDFAMVVLGPTSRSYYAKVGTGDPEKIGTDLVWTPNQWITVQLRFDVPNKQLFVWVNGNQYGPFENSSLPSGSYDSITLWVYNGTIRFDDIKVWYQ